MASLACSLPIGSAQPKDFADQVASAAAATLTSLAPLEMPTLPPVATTVVPTATLAPVPSATQAPQPDSPATLRLVFTDGIGSLFSWVEGEEVTPLVEDAFVENARLAPAGDWVVYTRSEADYAVSLWAVRFDGSRNHEVLSAADFGTLPLPPGSAVYADQVLAILPYQIEFLPGSSSVFFNTYPQFDGPGFALNNDLWRVDLESGALNAILPAGEGGSFTLSPDGSQMALVTPNDISLVNSDGSNRRSGVLTYTEIYTYTESPYYAAPRWDADGSFLRLILPPQDSLGDVNALSTIYELPVDGSAAKVLGSLAVKPLSGAIFSPDLEHILYAEMAGEVNDGNSAIKVAAYDGSDAIEIVRGEYFLIDWAPDSLHFAYQSWSPAQIYLSSLNATASAPAELAQATLFNWVDAQRYLFISQGQPAWELQLGSLREESRTIAEVGGGAAGYQGYDFMIP